MATLAGQTIASSYEQLLSLPDGGGNANTLVAVTDGDGGTTFGIKLATNKVEIIPGSNDANAFEVSQADGTAVLTVDSTNARVGIGGAPLKPLHILDDDPVIRISDANSSSLATATPHIEFYDRSDTNQLGMIGYLSTGDGILSIHNKNNASINFSTNDVERLEIDNAGTFFINGDGSDQTTKWHTGSAYVNAKLDVRQLAIAFSGSDKVTSDTSGNFTFANTLTVGSIADEGDAIITNGADGGRYDVLTVKENGATRWEVSFEGNAATNSLTFGSNVGEQNIANGGVLTLLPDGNVGIGCSPDSKLKIQENTNGENVAFAMRAHNDSGTSKTITFTLDPDDESLTLTNLAAYKIDQASTGSFGNTALQTIDGGDNAGVNIEHGGGDGRVRVASSGSFRTEYLANQLKANANGYDIRTTDSENVTISTNNSTRMTVAGSNGDVTVNALLVAGSGVAIGGTGSANTLDDYEEGTYTPSDSSGASLSFSSVTGNYVKIGTLCFVTLTLTFPSTSSGVTPRISVPFTTANDGVNAVGNVFPPSDDGISNAANGLIARTNANQTYIELIRKKEGSDADNSDLSGASISISITFRTT
jgi:hypothetical protein